MKGDSNKYKVFELLPENEWSAKYKLLKADCHDLMKMSHNDPVLNCKASDPSPVLGNLTNTETCYYCNLVIYEEMLQEKDGSESYKTVMTWLSMISFICCYMAGGFLLLQKDLRNTIPYPMIAASLLSLGSLCQINYTQYDKIEGSLFRMQEIGVFDSLKWVYMRAGILSQNASIF